MLHVVKSEEIALERSRAFTLSCVVPVFNEGAGITAFLQALQTAISKITPDFEIVVVNDGSTDSSGDRILSAEVGSKLRYLELSRNFGKEIAIQAGLDAADGDCVAILDADFQHPVDLIATMVDRWKTGVDMVYAVKRNRKGEGLLNRIAVGAFYRLLSPRRREPQIPRDAGDFRLLDRKVVMALRALPERDRFMKGLYAWVGFRSEAIEFMPSAREHGVSNFRFLRLASLAATGITSFSNLPLRWVSAAGVIVSAGAMAMACWLIIEKVLFGQPIPGFATLSASIFFFSGVQLLALGIVGEYVGRIFNEVKQRPRYILSNDVQRTAAERRRTDVRS
jgi:glycosyltransferase involved in cell wall biosynthesis